ncbi:hypothetical protein KAR28_00215 [Candidatus Parcubacteria bacterium]|nr:hypothetical protein [Candidatus Parcubacteria bacterium]
MKKIFIVLIFTFFLIINVNISQAGDDIDLYFFYGDGCPHCEKEEKFLERLKKEKDNINIHYFETWQNRDNAKLLASVGQELGINVAGVPILFISDQAIIGYYNDKITGKQIKDLIAQYERDGCSNIVGSIIGVKTIPGECVHSCDLNDSECIHNCGCSADQSQNANNSPDIIGVPFFGEIDVKKVSLPILTFLLAAADGFNPCAMWVLMFLISLLLGIENRRRMWALGTVFILASGAVYFLFLSAWLNLFLFLGFVFWIRISIALVALASGFWHLKEAWDSREGCKVTKSEKRKQVFYRLRALVVEKNFWIAIGGIIVLAAAVNLVELVCSAGLPAVYTSVLSLADLPVWQYYAYLLFYILIFMLDDLFIFVVAMTTLRIKAISSRYTKWSGWVGGIIMIVIGLLLLFKPGWIMFG